MVSWKKAVFFGGAVLVLAACGDATSPTSPALSKIDGPAASSTSSTKKSTDYETVPSSTTTTSDSTNVIKTECASVVIHAGIDGTLIPICVAVIEY